VEFGKLSNVDGVAFTLPPEDDRTAFVLREAPAREAGRLRLGTPAWSHREWVGEVYPTGTKPRDYLAHYARRFGCIELNSTHYAVPKPEIVQRWVDDTPAGFRFDAKVLQDISHRGSLASGRDELARFCDAMTGLGDRLGLVWLQLPPSVGPTRLDDLEGLLDGLPDGVQGAVELRHPGWFSERSLIPRAFDALAERDVALVITDVAGRRDLCHCSLPAPRTMVRFVGNELHPSDHERVAAWLPRLKAWLDAGAEALDFIVHQPGDLLSPRLADYIEDRLESRLGLVVRPPTQAVEPKPPTGQLTLF
jgi:uncharacterized protein YecE (DUF72 family)